MSVAFGELPPRSNGYIHHAPIAKALKERPGEWAECAQYSTAHTARHMAYIIRSGRLPAYEPAGAFEAEWRGTGNSYSVWARYVGTEGSS